MREVTPKELQKLNDKSFKNTQKTFCRCLREIAAKGSTQADFDKGHFCCEDKIITWLRSLGFKVTDGTCKYYITWPEEEDALEKLRKEVNDIWSRRVPVKFTWGVRLEREEPGNWTKDNVQWDYVCSACGKHSEYATDFCCNCGKKMMKEMENEK